MRYALIFAVAAMSAGCAPTGRDTPTTGADTDAAHSPASDAREPRTSRDADARDAGAPATATPSTDAPHATDAAAPRGIAVGEPDPSSPPPTPGDARYDGYGPLKFGMTADEARTAWPGGLQGDEVKADNCAYLRSKGSGAGPFLMFEGGRFVRYDMRGANGVAPGGGKVGLAADDIRRMYAGRVTEATHHYVQGGKYLRVADPASPSRALLFEVDAAGRVTEWRVGQTPQVDYVEGCS